MPVRGVVSAFHPPRGSLFWSSAAVSSMAGMPRPAGFGRSGVSGSCALRALANTSTAVAKNASLEFCNLIIFIGRALWHHDHVAGLQRNVRFLAGDDILVAEGNSHLLIALLPQDVDIFDFCKLRKSAGARECLERGHIGS